MKYFHFLRVKLMYAFVPFFEQPRQNKSFIWLTFLAPNPFTNIQRVSCIESISKIDFKNGFERVKVMANTTLHRTL